MLELGRDERQVTSVRHGPLNSAQSATKLTPIESTRVNFVVIWPAQCIRLTFEWRWIARGPNCTDVTVIAASLSEQGSLMPFVN